MTFSFAALRRYPDVEAPNLFAADAADRLILDTAADALAAAAYGATIEDVTARTASGDVTAGPGDVVVVGDHYGALTLGAAALYGVRSIRVHQDPFTSELALAANADTLGLSARFRSMPLGRDLFVGARIVLVQLPRSLDALDEIAAMVARDADPSVAVYAGGMVKHLTTAMNDVFGRHFARVQAGLARRKARVLSVSSPLSGSAAVPSRREFHDDLGLWVCASGAAFAGTKIDIGTRFLLGFLDQAKPDAVNAVDLGCGTGVLAAQLARARSALTVIATDQSAGAVASALATMRANGLGDRVSVLRDDGARSLPEASVDLVVLNPPFHIGSAVHSGAAYKLFEDAARILKPGGELLAVWNSHLAYPAALRRLVGPTRQLGRNAKFTVTASKRSA